MDPQAPGPHAIRRAAECLRAGGLVAFPTETVYGLGANALDPAAVQRIFEAKGRPPANPLIVHARDAAAARALALDWPPEADTLAHACWPGPLTLVVTKHDRVPGIVTAGGPTVALRVPDHPVALALLRAADVPIAAPSANRSGELSPTRAEHVLASALADRLDLLLDAGPTPGGIESTVIDLTVRPACVLRLGLLSPSRLSDLLGAPVCVARGGGGPAKPDTAAPAGSTEPAAAERSPGRMSRHYAPRARLEHRADAAQRVAELLAAGRRVGWLTFGVDAAPRPPADSRLRRIVMPADAGAYSARFYAALHELDGEGVEYIIVDEPPAKDSWLAIRDRLERASRTP
ncbi:MAG: threonylcarbamoyl-AMP synthase [Phycisphaerae bacterium]|nr:threonylcarbamoyl-AMP synthase [Phycisphaerae bacterium]